MKIKTMWSLMVSGVQFEMIWGTWYIVFNALGHQCGHGIFRQQKLTITNSFWQITLSITNVWPVYLEFTARSSSWLGELLPLWKLTWYQAKITFPDDKFHMGIGHVRFFLLLDSWYFNSSYMCVVSFWNSPRHDCFWLVVLILVSLGFSSLVH